MNKNRQRYVRGGERIEEDREVEEEELPSGPALRGNESEKIIFGIFGTIFRENPQKKKKFFFTRSRRARTGPKT